MKKSLQELESERTELLRQFAKCSDMRRGSITEVYRSCGKSNCACTHPDHPGHGPFYAYTTKVNGKTKTLQLRPGSLLSKIEREAAEYKRFRALCDHLVNVNERICDARPVAQPDAQEKKRRFSRPLTPRSSRRSKR